MKVKYIICVLLIFAALTCSGSRLFVVAEVQTWTGWIIDSDCVGADPVKHSTACLKMEECIKSGLGILVYTPNDNYKNYKFLLFDYASQSLGKDLINHIPDGQKNNVTIKVTGTQNVKEEIVVSKIEFYNIAGGSTWQIKTEAHNDNAKLISVKLNGNLLSFDVPPRVINNRTLVPLREIFEYLGASISWNEKSKTVTAVKKGKKLKLQIGNKKYSVNDIEKEIDVPAVIIDGRTFVPTRVAAENLDVSVNWDNNSKTVILTN